MRIRYWVHSRRRLMVKTRKSAVETIGDHSDDELEIVRRRSVRLLAPMNGGESGKNAIEEETSPKTEEADEDEVSSPDENWQETPRRSTRKLLEKSRKLFEKEEAKAERNVKIKKQKDESDGDGRRRSGRQRSVLFDTLNLSLIGEQLWSSDRERQYHVKGIHDEMESDVEPYESILTLTGRRKGSKRIRTTRSQQRHSDTSKAKTHQAEDQEQEDASEQETSGNSKENSDEDEDDDSDEDTPPKSYFLRQHKPAVQRYTIPIETSRSNPNLFNSPARRKHFHRHGTSMSHRRRFQAHHVASSTSSSNSDEEDERKFQRRKDKSMTRARSQLLPMNMTPNDMKRGILRDRQKVGSSLADTEPMSIDRSITFEHIGGLSRHVEALKEMLVFPLLYPEVFEKFRINPPRGVLFHGAPGTGKTLVARALANECAKSGQKVAFFMRKGADCLSKWVGESERQLRLLFDQAYMMRPSIIFFDEIDGLAPVRSTRQDQIHSSIVSTLLALMDGLDSRGEVIVIGATNRIDAIDPALRRPGRFDGEFLFPMPCQEARRQILSIHTSSWHPPLNPNLLTSLTNSTVGYCGADLKGLCTEAAMFALRRTFPQIYTTPNRLQLDINQISVESQDFHRALKKMLPTAQRSNFSSGRALNSMIRPLLQLSLDAIYSDVVSLLPAVRGLSSSLTTGSSVEDSFSVCDPLSEPFSFQPRMLVCGVEGMGQVRHLGAALVHLLESLPCHTMDVASLHRMGTRTSEEACVQVVHEAQRMAPSVIYIPDIQSVWASTQSTFHSIFESLVNAIPSSITVLLLATADCPYLSLPDGVQALFSHSSAVVEVDTPCESARRSFLESLFLDFPFRVPPKVVEAKQLPPLPVAASLPSRQMSKNEVTRLEERREETLRELRIFLRDCTNKLIADRKFKVFTKPVDPEEAPDYYEVVTTPMDLSIIMNKIDCREYRTVKHWLADIDLITSNCIEYNPDSQAQGKLLRHRAWGLKDFAHALITREMDSDFEELCQELENNYQELLRSNDTPATVSSTPQISTNPTTTNDTQMARKSLRVRGIKAETPPPLSNLKKARRNDSSYESTPVKPNQTLDEEDDKTDANEDDTIIIEDVTDVSISEEMQLSPAVDDKPESAVSPTSVEQCKCSDSHETRKVSVREEKTPESDRETHGNEAEPIATDELHDQSPDGNCVLADKAVFSELLERAVAVTCRATVSELEGIYSRLSQLIYLRRLELDKSVLVSDMVECIRRLELERNG